MKRGWTTKNFLLLSFTLAAMILGTLIAEMWAKPAQSSPYPTSTMSSLAAGVPRECVNLDKTIRKATRLSTILDADHNAVIGPSSPNGVYVDDKTPQQLGRIEIPSGGTLYVPDSPIDVKVGAIVVAGTFEAGTQACPIGTLNPGNKVILRFVGERPESVDPTEDDCMNPDTFQKGIQVAAGGSVRLFGAKGVPLYDQNGVRKPESGVSWTHLSKPAGPKYDPNFALFTPDTKQYFTEISPVTSKPTGVKAPVSAADIGANSQTLHLEDDVTRGDNPWQVGDWIVVATTSFTPFESEFVKITDVKKETTGTGSFVVVADGLRHYHFGGLDPGPPSDKNYHDDNNTNFGVDERAEVGLSAATSC